MDLPDIFFLIINELPWKDVVSLCHSCRLYFKYGHEYSSRWKALSDKIYDFKNHKKYNYLEYIKTIKNPNTFVGCCYSGLNSVKKLVSKGASINNGVDRTPLIVASSIGSLEIIKYLIENGANDLEAAFKEACFREHLDVASFFLTQGVSMYSIHWDTFQTYSFNFDYQKSMRFCRALSHISREALGCSNFESD